METCKKMSFIFFNFTLLICLPSLTIPNALARHRGPRNIDGNVSSEINVVDLKRSEIDFVDVDVQNITESSQSVFTKVNDNENVIDSTISHVQYVSEYNVTDFISSNSENTLGQLTSMIDSVLSSSGTTKIHSIDYPVVTEALIKDTNSMDTLSKISLYNVEEPPISVTEVFSEMSNSELSVTPASQVNTEQVLPVNNIDANKNLTSSLLHKDFENTTSIKQSSPTMQTIQNSFSLTEKPNLNSPTTEILLNIRRKMLLVNNETSVSETSTDTSVADELPPVLGSVSISAEITSTSLSDTVISTSLTNTFISTSVSEDNINKLTLSNPSTITQTEEIAVQATNANSGDTVDTTNTPEYQDTSTQVVTAQTANSEYQTDSDIDADTGISTDSGIDADTGISTDSGIDADTGISTDSGIDADTGISTDSDIDAGTERTTMTVTDSDTGMDIGFSIGISSSASTDSGSTLGSSTDSDVSSNTNSGSTSDNNITTTEDTKDCIPDSESINVSAKSTTIEVIWDFTSKCEIGTKYNKYNISWTNTKTGISEYDITEEENYTITSLQSCTEYNIIVELLEENENTATRITANTSAHTLLSTPNLMEISKNKTFAVFECSIADPCVPSNCIVNCTANDGNSFSGNSSEFTNGSTRVNVTGLSPFTNYYCKGYASADSDISEESEKVNIKTLEDAPPAPKIDNIVEFSRSLNISWTINEEEVPGEIGNFTITADFMDSNATTSCGTHENETCFCDVNNYTRYEVVDAEKRSHSLSHLKPYSNFKVTVSASTNGGSNTSEAKSATTKADQSEAVRSLKYSISEGGDINWKIVLNWELPCNTEGELKGFYINVTNISCSRQFYEDYSPLNCCEFILSELQPDSNYTILVSAYVDDINGSLSDSVQFTYPPGIPEISDAAHLTADPSATSTPTQTRITFNRDLFQGQIIWYEIIVAQKGKEEQPINKLYADFTEIPHINCWNNAVGGESYRATPDKWNPFHGKSNEIATFILGDQKCDDNGYYCNGALKAETDYAVKIRAYTGSNQGGFQDSTIIYFTTGGEVAVGVIVGIVMAIIVLGSLAILFIMYRRGTLVWPPKFFKKSKQTTVRPQPILLKKFPAYCVQLLEMPNRLKNEFQLLATLSFDINTENTTVYGEQPENRKKNRYINILPYDATRVILNLIDGDQTSHYINASFIQGYNSDIEYIASQGPLEDTCEDFWRMVYQHDVRVIAMVTNLVEQNKLKCHQYYPNLRENLVFGDMTIRCTTEINFPIHTARTLILIKEGRERKISHLHFREWPDFGVPQSTDFMLQFCQTMRHHAMAAQVGLILVHCSAGVGRTGTLIAIDILLQHISENKKVDIFGTVYKLRKQRTNMVQTEGQYTYIYRCIKDAVEDPTIVNQGTTSNSSLEPIYENVGTTLNSLQYEKLPKVSYKSSSSESECEL